MRILVCSDSHGSVRNIMLAADQQPNADAYVFLGDGVRDAEFLRSFAASKSNPPKPVYLLQGNCDGAAPYPVYETFQLAGKTVLCTHGHYDHVKFGRDTLLYRAEEQGADLCLFGHTHTPYIGYEAGIHLFNPGSIRDGIYGFADITPAGIVCQHVRVREIF